MTIVVTITHALTENTDEIFVVTLAQAIGLIELGKAVLIESA